MEKFFVSCVHSVGSRYSFLFYFLLLLLRWVERETCKQTQTLFMFYSLFHLHIVHVFGFYCVRVWRERVCIFDVRTIACLHGSTVCLTQVPFLSQGRQGKRGRGVGEGREEKKMSHRACLGVITGYNYRICRHKPDYLKILPPPTPISTPVRADKLTLIATHHNYTHMHDTLHRHARSRDVQLPLPSLVIGSKQSRESM